MSRWLPPRLEQSALQAHPARGRVRPRARFAARGGRSGDQTTRAEVRKKLAKLPVGMVLAASIALSGCGGWFSKEEIVNPPAELVDVEQEIEVDELWSRRVGAGVSEHYLKLRPLVESGRVYVAERKGRVVAYEVRDGDEIWRTETETSISGGVGGGDGLVLVGSSDGDVVALSAETGEEKWRTRVSSEVLAPPVAANGVAVTRTADGKLFGLSVSDGSRLWVYDRTVPVLTLRGTSTPVLVSGAAVSGFDSGQLVAVSLENGQALWESRIAMPRGRSELERLVDIDADPLVADRVVYAVTYQGRIAALDLFSGNVIWQRDMSSYAGLGVQDEIIYVTDTDSYVWALDRRNSASLWRQDKLQHRQLTAPLGIGRYVVVGDFEGYVHWLSRDDGRMLARVRVDSSGILAPPVVYRDVVLIYGKGGTLTALQVP
ncbi:MAG: outer membrane protein assembly factor BamB [Gammaproteobacteria bacterium]|nr:outer membrane protein assembly factor BamB [Gammaproteobacteria bacterium]